MGKSKLFFISLTLLLVVFLFTWMQTKKGEDLAQDSKKKLLVLIIASDNHPVFLELQGIWRAYMHLDPKHVTAYFLKGDPDLKTASEIRGDVLYTKVLDDYQPGILKKTIFSMEALSDKLDTYDYVLRTNLSSFYDFPNLLSYLQTAPKQGYYSALPMLPSHNLPVDVHNTPFGWGAGFVLSPDLVKMMVNQKEELFERSHCIPDDVAIGVFLNKRQIPIVPTTCLTLRTRDDWENLKDKISSETFHYRAKSHYDYRKLADPYSDELYLVTQLVNRVYPQVTLKQDFQSAYPLNVPLLTIHLYHTAYPSDINEHLPILRKLAQKGSSVTEIGMRAPDLVSTWSLLQGLSENPLKKRTFVAIGNNLPSHENLLLAHKVAKENEISFKFIQSDEKKLDIEPTDLLFIDSLHTYCHLTCELEKFAPNVRNYIVVHDTSEPWGDRDDTEYLGDYSEYPKEIDRTKRGLWPAIVDFLKTHPEWTLKERHLNNHGLTILQRLRDHP